MKTFKVELDIPYIEGISVVMVQADNREEALEMAIELVLSIKGNCIDVLFAGEWETTSKLKE